MRSQVTHRFIKHLEALIIVYRPLSEGESNKVHGSRSDASALIIVIGIDRRPRRCFSRNINANLSGLRN